MEQVNKTQDYKPMVCLEDLLALQLFVLAREYILRLIWVMSTIWASLAPLDFQTSMIWYAPINRLRYPSYSQRASPSSGGFFSKAFAETPKYLRNLTVSAPSAVQSFWMSWNSKSTFQNWTAKSEGYHGYPQRTFATTCDFETFEANEGSQSVAKYSFCLIHSDPISSL